ncbi:MAG: sensor histidine kinase [Solirubrobacteraceae bacterium]
MTLQRRVLAYLALAAIASCALSFGVAVILVRHRISAQRLSGLESQAAVLALVGGAPGALAAGDHVYRVSPPGGHPEPLRPRARAAVLAKIPAGGNDQGTIQLGRRSLLYVARTSAAGRIVLVRGARLAFAEWRPFLISLGLAGLGGILLAALLSYLLASRLTRPIGALASATQRLAAGEPGVEVPVTGEDELAGLGRAFNDMSAELGRARESQRRFLESVSHELKTPLTSIRGYAEGLQEGAVAAPEGGRVIGAEAGRLERLVFDLVDLARLGRSDFAIEHERVDLNVVARAAVARHLPRARELGVQLTGSAGGTGLDAEGGTGLHAERDTALDAGGDRAWGIGDEDRLLQATANLIENALRLTPAGGRVTVTTGPGWISVRDTGPGLAPEDLPRAFERFYLHDRYRSERAVGSGLGLAIVKELTTAMGGGVEASRAPSGGAEFTLRIPVGPG